MLKAIFSMILLLGIVLVTAVAEQNTQSYKAGKEFELLRPSQPTDDPKRVEVIEFFWYGCPHCYRFEPYLNEWLKTLPEHVQYIRQPTIFGKQWAMHAKAYFTAEVLEMVDKVHQSLFDSIQNKKKPLQTEQELAEFFASHGIGDDEFRSAFNSFMVDTKMRQAASLSARYGITAVPTVVINGKYRTSAAISGGFPGVIRVMDFLIKKEHTAMAN